MRLAEGVRTVEGPSFLPRSRRSLPVPVIKSALRHATLGAVVALLSVGGDAWAANNEVILVSRASGARGAAGDGGSAGPSVSGDGRFVTFQSRADNLSDEDNDAVINVYVRDLEAATTTLVSRASGPSEPAANGDSVRAKISADGRFVVFQSSATNLSANDVNGGTDVFVRDLDAGTTTLASRVSGPAGAPRDGASNEPSVSSDGRFVAFESDALNLSSEDAAFVDVFVRDLQTNTTTLVTRASAGAADGPAADAPSFHPSISADGRYVAFQSGARNLSDDDLDATGDVFVRDLQARTTTLVSRASDAAGGAAADQSAMSPSISGDGRVVAFASDAANLDENNLNVTDIFVRDMNAGTTSLASRASGPAGTPSDGTSVSPSISANGRFIAFQSEANTLSDASVPGEHIYVRDRLANLTALVSRASGPAGAAADGASSDPALSGDGRMIAFDSIAKNLSSEDSDAFDDVFARDMLSAPPAVGAAPGSTASGPPLDTVGPFVSARALSRANRTIRVGSDGHFRLFCGRFAEAVTGRCGGTGKPRARRRFDLGMRAFGTRAGRRVLLRFRLSRTR